MTAMNTKQELRAVVELVESELHRVRMLIEQSDKFGDWIHQAESSLTDCAACIASRGSARRDGFNELKSAARRRKEQSANVGGAS